MVRSRNPSSRTFSSRSIFYIPYRSHVRQSAPKPQLPNCPIMGIGADRDSASGLVCFLFRFFYRDMTLDPYSSSISPPFSSSTPAIWAFYHVSIYPCFHPSILILTFLPSVLQPPRSRGFVFLFLEVGITDTSKFPSCALNPPCM